MLVILVTEKKERKKETPNSYLRADFEKDNVDRSVGTYRYGIFTYGLYTDGEQTRTKGQFGHGELTCLRLSSARGKGTAGLTAGLGRQSTGTELHGRASGLF